MACLVVIVKLKYWLLFNGMILSCTTVAFIGLIIFGRVWTFSSTFSVWFWFWQLCGLQRGWRLFTTIINLTRRKGMSHFASAFFKRFLVRSTKVKDALQLQQLEDNMTLFSLQFHCFEIAYFQIWQGSWKSGQQSFSLIFFAFWNHFWPFLQIC